MGLTESQLDFTLGYLNKHHTDVLVAIADTFSELGVEKAKKNAWSGGSYKIESAKIVDINTEKMELDVSIQERGKDLREERVEVELGKTFDCRSYSSQENDRLCEGFHETRPFPHYSSVIFLDAMPVSKTRISSTSNRNIQQPISRNLNLHPVDEIIRRLCRLCWIVDKQIITGKLVQLGVQIGETRIGEIKENLYLNQVPHNRYVRQVRVLWNFCVVFFSTGGLSISHKIVRSIFII
jgi:hypothetical protein